MSLLHLHTSVGPNGRAARSRAPKTRMNTRFSPGQDGPNETRGAIACGLSGGGSLCAFRQPAIGRRAGRVRRDAQWWVARCHSRCRDGNWSRAIRNSRSRNRDDRRGIALLAPMQRRLRSTATPLPRQVLLHSWSNLLAFDCLAQRFRAVYSFSSFTTLR